MNTKHMWTMHIPVISTQHMPSTHSLVSFEGLAATYPEGGFVYLPDDPDKDMWTVPILAWLREHLGSDANWIRFDCDADVIYELPTYDWKENEFA
jgi:hypothetical protein